MTLKEWCRKNDFDDQSEEIQSAWNAALDEAEKSVWKIKGGYAASPQGEMIPDIDGPWILNREVAEAVRALKVKPNAY